MQAEAAQAVARTSAPALTAARRFLRENFMKLILTKIKTITSETGTSRRSGLPNPWAAAVGLVA